MEQGWPGRQEESKEWCRGGGGGVLKPMQRGFQGRGGARVHQCVAEWDSKREQPLD